MIFPSLCGQKGAVCNQYARSLLKKMVSRMKRISEDISRAFQDQQNSIGGSTLKLVDIVKILPAITSSQPTFMCVGTQDECAGVQQVGLLHSLN